MLMNMKNKINDMQSRFDILKSFLKKANPNDFSYSATMRKIRKEHPEKVVEFMDAFKRAFDEAQNDEIENIEQIALMQAVKSIGLM